jgi:hypothetical protein
LLSLFSIDLRDYHWPLNHKHMPDLLIKSRQKNDKYTFIS